MGIFEIISAIVLIIACVFIVLVVLMQDTKTQMSQTISGSSGDNYFGKNSGRTKEAMLNKATTVAAVVFFVLALAVNIINLYFGGSAEDTASDTSSSISVDASDILAETESSAAEESTPAEESAPVEGAPEESAPAENAPAEESAPAENTSAEESAPAEGAAAESTSAEGAGDTSVAPESSVSVPPAENSEAADSTVSE